MSHHTGYKKALEQLRCEINVLSTLSHPNVVKYYGSSNANDQFCLFLEYVGGQTLQELICQSKGLDIQVAKLYTRQLLEGLN